MATDVKKNTSPAPGEVPSRKSLADGFLSASTVVPVASATEQGQIASALSSTPYAVGPSRPMATVRADARPLHQLEVSRDGSVFVPTSGVLSFATVSARDAWTSANSSLLTAGDQCVVGSTTYVWSGTIWQNNTMFIAGMAGPVNGSASTDTRFLVQFGSRAGVADVNNNLSLTFPVAFPNGLVMVIATPGDAFTSMKQTIPSAYTKTGCDIQCLKGDGTGVGAVAVRYNWIAIGF